MDQKELFELANPYLWRLVQRVENVDLFCLRRLVGPIPFPVDQIFIPLKVSQRHLMTGVRPEEMFDDRQLRYLPDSQKESCELDTILQILFAAESRRSLVIIGKPGSGKTTLLLYLAYYYSQRRQTEIGEQLTPRIPFYLRLKDIAATITDTDSTHSLVSILSEDEVYSTHLAAAEIETCLKQGALVLFDGMDEVADVEQREAMAEWIQKTVNDYDAAFFVISSRAVGFSPDYAPIGSIGVEIDDFNENQRREFLYRWFGHVKRQPGRSTADWDANAVANGLAEVIESDNYRHLQDLARNPLLLSMIALVSLSYIERGGKQIENALPVSRTELYQRCVDLFIEEWRWDAVRDINIDMPNAKTLLTLLEHAALVCHRAPVDDQNIPGTSNKEALIEQLSTQQDLEAGLIDQCLNYSHERSLLLVEHALDTWGFQHKTFQEYLCSCYLLNQLTPDKPDSLDLILNNLGKDHWRVVWELLVEAQTDEQNQPKDQLARIIYTAGQRFENDPEFIASAWDWIEALHDNKPFEFPSNDSRRLQHAAWKYCTHSGNVRSWNRAYQFAARGLSDDIINSQRYLQRLNELESDLTAYVRLISLAAELFPQPPKEVYDYFIQHLQQADAQNDTVRSTVALILQRWGFENQVELDDVLYVKIPASEFYRGSRQGDDDYNHDNVDGERYAIGEYEISRYPVSNNQYAEFVKASGHTQPRLWRDGKIPAALNNHPVVWVSWHDAMAYIKWLNSLQHNYRYSLPTEAQWERAARGPAEIEDRENRRIYPWGNEFDAAKCNVFETGLGRTTVVGCFPESISPEGISDMAGNVFEWCDDWYDDDYYKRKTIDENTEKSDFKVIRGSSFDFDQRPTRCTFRNDGVPFIDSLNVGFRVARIKTLKS